MSDLQIGIIVAAVGTVLSVIAAVTIPLSRGIWERFFKQFRSTAVPGMVKDKPTVKERFIFALEGMAAVIGVTFLLCGLSVIGKETGHTGALIPLPEPFSGWTACIFPVTIVLTILLIGISFMRPQRAPKGSKAPQDATEPDGQTRYLVSLSRPGLPRAAVIVPIVGGLLNLLFAEQAAGSLMLFFVAGIWCLAARDSLTADSFSWDAHELRHVTSFMGIRQTTVIGWDNVVEVSRYARPGKRRVTTSPVMTGSQPYVSGLRIVYRSVDGKKGAVELDDSIFPDMTELYRALRTHGVYGAPGEE